jgi:class 3 adenylate cyclase
LHLRSHRLAAIWFADIAGYTELSTNDEDRTVRGVSSSG